MWKNFVGKIEIRLVDSSIRKRKKKIIFRFNKAPYSEEEEEEEEAAEFQYKTFLDRELGPALISVNSSRTIEKVITICKHDPGLIRKIEAELPSFAGCNF